MSPKQKPHTHTHPQEISMLITNHAQIDSFDQTDRNNFTRFHGPDNRCGNTKQTFSQQKNVALFHFFLRLIKSSTKTCARSHSDRSNRIDSGR